MQSKKLLVFPTSRSLREYLESLKDTNQILPKIITIGDFFQKAINIGSYKFCDSELRTLYLNQAILNVDFKSLGLSSDFNSFLKQSEYIFRFFDELSSEYKVIEDLNHADTYAHYSDHLDILNEIRNNYANILKQHNYADMTIIPSIYNINEEFILEFDKIELIYEGYFSKYEFNIVKKISEITKLNIYLTLNEFNRKNIHLFKSLGIDLEKNKRYIIDVSNKQIINRYDLVNNNESMIIEPQTSRINQIGFIKYAITQMINKGIKAEKIAVVLPDESFSSLLELFDDEKYFNFAMGKSIKDSKLIQVAKVINKQMNDPEPKELEKLKFYDIDIMFINKTIKSIWNKQVTKAGFKTIIEYIKSYEKNEEVLDKLAEVEISLDRLLFTSSIKILTKDAFKIFMNKISEIRLDDVYSGKITVLGLLESRNIEFDGIIVIDFNENFIPKRSIKDKYISTGIKDLAGLPTARDREDLQKYYYKKLFDSAKYLYISYVKDDQNRISRFFHEIFPNVKVPDSTKNFEEILYKNRQIEHNDNDIILDIDLSKNEWSATSLKRYLECKRKYYLNNILQIKEHNISLKPQSYELGNIIHLVLEEFYGKYVGKSNEKIDFEEIKYLIGKYQSQNPYLGFELEIYKRKLDKFIENEKKRFDEGITLFAVEKPFKFNHKGITIKGKIDRVDKSTDGTYSIIDYKTSSALKIDSIKNYENSIDFQLEFYYFWFEYFMQQKHKAKPYYYDLNIAELKEEILLKEKLVRLDDIFDSLHTVTVNFEKCGTKSTCNYCAYKTICNR